MSSPDQIEARALSIHQERKANRARNHGQHLADLMTFDGGERDYCLRIARETIEIEEHNTVQQTAEDCWYAAQFAAMSDQDIELGIRSLDEEFELLPYASLTVNIADRRKGLIAEKNRMVAEQLRRSVAAGMKVAAE